jgi:hypothetical protein
LLSVTYIPSKSVLMLSVWHTTLYQNLGTTGREVGRESCGCVGELYIMDNITEGVTILLRLFSDDSIASLEKLVKLQ